MSLDEMVFIRVPEAPRDPNERFYGVSPASAAPALFLAIPLEDAAVIFGAFADEGESPRCFYCGHTESSHRWEPGFYDARGHFAACEHVGCPCGECRPERGRQ